MNKPKTPPVTAVYNDCYHCKGIGKEPKTIRCYHDDYECHMPYGHILKRKGSKCHECGGKGWELDESAWFTLQPFYIELERKKFENFKKFMFEDNGKGFLSRFFAEGLDTTLAYRREVLSG